ncbi:hypothetical protein ACFWVM_29090 [Nocardia fluminea]|uniref:hypothetical protein n=1 Tax=Nocardia fluminea TaxID=134984 RepID=UPI0036647659
MNDPDPPQSRALGYVIDPADGAGVVWEEATLTWAAERMGCEYVGTTSSTPQDVDPIGDLIAALREARASVLVVPSLVHLGGEIPIELLKHFRVCVEDMGVLYSIDGGAVSIPSRSTRRSTPATDGPFSATAAGGLKGIFNLFGDHR